MPSLVHHAEPNGGVLKGQVSLHTMVYMLDKRPFEMSIFDQPRKHC